MSGSRRRLETVLEWSLLFVAFAAAIWLATQSRLAPQLVLLVVLAIIAVNFSIPVAAGAISPVLPVVSIAGLLVVGPGPALAALASGLLLAALSRPLWRPLRQDTPLAELGWPYRVSRGALHLLLLTVVAWIYAQAGGQAPLTGERLLAEGTLPAPLLPLTLGYAVAYTVGFSLLNRFWQPARFTADSLLFILMVAALTQPFALFGAISFVTLGLPAFVVFCVGAGAFAIVSWLAWQRHYVLQRQLDQFASLNSVGASLRETLELEEVLERTYRQVDALVPADRFAIALRHDDGTWEQPLHAGPDAEHDGRKPFRPDDFTRWVVENECVLDLDARNMHYAAKHDLQAPQPEPSAWLGIPLTTADGVMGAMVLQRFPPQEPFSRWSREVLLAIAGQASAAIQNARLYSETRRLYNLTDQALAERVRQLQALLNSTSEGVLMFNTIGEVVLVNPTAARLLNTPRHRLQGQALDPAQAAVPLGYEPNELAQLLRDVQRLQRPESRRTVYKFTVQAGQAGNGEDPRRRFLERNETPVLSGDDELLGWLIVLRDVTEQEERNEWRTNVTRMIVHDLRNPVTTLISDLDFMQNALEAGDVEKMRRHVQQACRGCDDMLDMIDSLMDMTRLEAGQMIVDEEAIRLPPLAETVLARLQPLAHKKQISLSLEVDPQLPAAWADADMMRRVFVNLLDNAMKFTPSGGSVRVAFNKEAALPQHEPGLRCTVTDTGPGVPDAYRDLIFERFTRVNAGGGQVRGTGLGLAFCKLAVEAHGGQIWVQDSPQGGSRFVFTIPGVPDFDAVSAFHTNPEKDERRPSP